MYYESYDDDDVIGLRDPTAVPDAPGFRGGDARLGRVGGMP